MLIDRTHRPWFWVTVILLGLGIASYIPYRLLSVEGALGGSVMGLIYGSIGSALMLFAGLLGARKKHPTWRVGRATTWMRGHLWLGFLSFPFILFHAGFRLGGGALTRTLMVLFIFVFVSGLAGAALQHYLPRRITEAVALETVYDQIDYVRGQLVTEAEALMAELERALQGELAQADERQRASAAAAGTMGGLTVASAMGADDEVCRTVSDFFHHQLKPFLAAHGPRASRLAKREGARGMFGQLKVLVPANLWPRFDDLESICAEKRELDIQRRLHRVLHGWLLVHIPLSYALLLLGAVHAVIALRY